MEVLTVITDIGKMSKKNHLKGEGSVAQHANFTFLFATLHKILTVKDSPHYKFFFFEGKLFW